MLPHKIGTRLAWNFPLRIFSRRNFSEDEQTRLTEDPDESTIDIIQLSKQYSADSFALVNVSLQLNSNEITVLLGKNGAGKSTLIHILTGVIEPSDGSIKHSSSFGLCPQHDIVWPDLTVEDHFEIFGKLRNMDQASIRDQQNHLLAILGLPFDHQNVSVKNLSGGMRRKLAVGLSFLGNSRCVILDEPTSGLDPFSRRQLWDAIMQLKDNRIVVLSTHYMDEAEVVGDRIVILAEGRVKANGSPIQLRRQFDCGYTFVLKSEDEKKISSIGTMVHSTIPEVSVEIFSDKAEFFVPINLENAIEHLLIQLTEYMGNSPSLISVTSTRLEEVFMRVTSHAAPTSAIPVSTGYTELEPVADFISTNPSILKSVVAIVQKRFRMFIRDLRSSLVNHLYPILVILFGLFVRSDQTTSPESFIQSMDNLMLVLFVSVGFSSVPSSISHLINSEKKSHSKFLQYISGLSPIAYWIGNFLADITEYLIFPFGVTVFLFAFFAPPTIPLTPLVFLLLAFGPAIIAQTYLITILIPNPVLAQLVSVLISTIVGGILPMVGFMFTQATQLLNEQPTENNALEIILAVARFFPAYNLGQGLVTIPMVELIGKLAHAIDPSSAAAEMYDWTNLGAPLTWMCASVPLYLVLTLVIDHAIYTHKFSRLFNCFKRGVNSGFTPLSLTDTDETEDESITAERERVLDTSDPPLLGLVGVSKQYSVRSNFFAVNRVCLGIPSSGEIFGLLGHNGAGKSTLMKLCTGEILPSFGNVLLSPNLNTKFDVEKFHSIVGYCPQFDALIDSLTVKDHFELYGRIKGIDRGVSLDHSVSNLISKLGLAEYESSKIKHLSGGYKRRVSLGIALIGNPVLLLLDEPTCGMDPIARRDTWTVIKSVASTSASVVLTTHSMEEAESISTRVGIMSRGKMVCLGTVESLREKFSNGVEIFIQTKFVNTKIFDCTESFLSICEQHSVKRAKRFMASGLCVLTNSVIAFSQWWAQEEVNDLIEDKVYAVATDHNTVLSSVSASGRSIRMVLVPPEMTTTFLTSIFGLLSSMRIKGDIVDFSVNQNSLEQVFNSITAVEADVNGDRDQSTEQVSQLE